MLTRLLSALIVFPLLLRYRMSPNHRLFKRMAETISVIPGNLGLQVRSRFYRNTLKKCGERTEFGFGTILNYPDISIGKEVSFGRYCQIGLVDFGDYVLVASLCQFLSGRHTHEFGDLQAPIRHQPSTRTRITVGNDVWVGSGAIVMASIGDGAVIGAGSVVTRPVEPWHVVAGNPARPISRRGREQDAADARAPSGSAP